jgi:hypothetical protein
MTNGSGSGKFEVVTMEVSGVYLASDTYLNRKENSQDKKMPPTQSHVVSALRKSSFINVMIYSLTHSGFFAL